jgi:hypothetical protein
MPTKRTKDTKRLFDAADALLRAIASPDGFETTVEASVGGTGRGGSLRPGLFTISEYIEAMQMLVRNGLVNRAGRPGPANTSNATDFAGPAGDAARPQRSLSGAATLASLLLNAPGLQRCGSGGFSDITGQRRSWCA